MGIKGRIDGIVGSAKHVAANAALLAALSLASAGCGLFGIQTIPTPSPPSVPPPAAAAPAPTDTPVPPTPTPPVPTPSPSPTRAPATATMTAFPLAAAPAVTGTAVMTGTPVITGTPASVATSTPPAATATGTATATATGTSTATATAPSYLAGTATPFVLPRVAATPTVPPSVAATAVPPLPLGVLRADYSIGRGYVNDSESLYSRAQTNYNDPAGARQVFCGLESQIIGSAESVLARDYPTAMARDRTATLTQRVRGVCSASQRMLGWVLYHASLYVQRTARFESRFMVGVEIGVPGRESDYFRAPLPDTLHARLAADYGFPPDVLVPLRPCSPAPCR